MLLVIYEDIILYMILLVYYKEFRNSFVGQFKVQYHLYQFLYLHSAINFNLFLFYIKK